jgi:hypothetical protein
MPSFPPAGQAAFSLTVKQEDTSDQEITMEGQL